jgi:uncharacterized protein YciI
MFILNLNYVKPVEEIETYLPNHREFLDYYYERSKFLLSGPKVPRNGGIILCDAKDRDEVFEIISKDPFYINKVAVYDAVEFQPVKTSSALIQYKK